MNHQTRNKEVIESFLNATYQAYRTHGNRSPKKLAPFHSGIAAVIKQKLAGRSDSAKFSFHGTGCDNPQEKAIPTLLGKKNVDVTVSYDDRPIIAIQLKAPMANYSQNSYNYIENFVGENFLMRKANPDLVIVSGMFLPIHMPYMEKAGTVKHLETVSSSIISKYKAVVETALEDGLIDSYLFALYARQDIPFLLENVKKRTPVDWNVLPEDSKGVLLLETLENINEQYTTYNSNVANRLLDNDLFSFIRTHGNLLNQVDDIISKALEQNGIK